MSNQTANTSVGKRLLCWGAALIVLLLLIRYVPGNLLPSAERAFSLSMTDTPDTMAVGDSLTVDAVLKHAPFRSFIATTGTQCVYIELTHEDDPPIAYPDIAKTRYLAAGGRQTVTKTLTPTKAGTYTLRVFASFSIGGRNYTIALPDRTITVT